MSAPEQERQAPEGLSSVKLVRNAKGDVQIECKVYASTNDPTDVAYAASETQRLFDEIVGRYPIGGAS